MSKKMMVPMIKLFGVPSKFKWDKTLTEWMGLGAKVTAYLSNKYGEGEVIAFWDYNTTTMIPFWKKQNIQDIKDFTNAMLFLSEVTNTKIKVERQDKHEASAIVQKCGFKESVEKYKELVDVPKNFPCSYWCKPFWMKISDSLGFDCTIEDTNHVCRFIIRESTKER